jgi:hypothetical protein
MRMAHWLLTSFFILLSIGLLCIGAAQERTTYPGRSLTDFPGPQVYKDPASGTLLYVETDGRHVAAISCAGKLLWKRDPFHDAHLPFYRTEKPQIVYLGPDRAGGEPGKFVTIAFNSSQFGVMRISDGEFRFRGQD